MQKKKKDPYKRYPIVEVTWDDSASQGKWGTDESYRRNADTIECKSMGYLLSRNKKKVVLIQSISEEHQCCDSISIPAKCVKRVRRFRM